MVNCTECMYMAFHDGRSFCLHEPINRFPGMRGHEPVIMAGCVHGTTRVQYKCDDAEVTVIPDVIPDRLEIHRKILWRNHAVS